MKINKSELLEKLEKIFKSKNNKTSTSQISDNNFALNNRLNKIIFTNNKNDFKKKNTNIKTNRINRINRIEIDVNNVIKRINSKGKHQKNSNNKSNRNINNVKCNNTDVFNKKNNIYKKNISIQLNNSKNNIYNNSSSMNNYNNFINNNESINEMTFYDNYNTSNNLYRKTYGNFYNYKHKLLKNSASMKNYLEDESLFQRQIQNFDNKKENIKNNLTININERQNNYIEKNFKSYFNNKNYHTINSNSNYNINKRKMMRYKCNLTKEFIKYIKRFISLFLIKYKFLFLIQLKNKEIEKEKNTIFHKTSLNNYYLRNNNNNQYNLTERNSDFINESKNNNNCLFNKNDIYSFERTYNNFYEPFRNSNNTKKKKKLILNRIDEFNNNPNEIFHNYLTSHNNIDISTLSEEEENSQLLSISISSKEDFDSTSKKCMNNRSINKSNRLFLKLKDNKNNDNSFNNNRIYSNNITLSNNKSVTNNIYVKKKHLNTGNNINSNMKKRENYQKSNIMNNDKKLGKGYSEEKLINNSSYLYINKKIIYKSAKKKNINKEINFPNKNNNKRYTTITKDNKLHISINSININNYKKNKNIIKYEKLHLSNHKLSFKIIDRIFIFEKPKKNEIYTKIKNNDNYYHYMNNMNNRNNLDQYNSFVLNSEEKQQRIKEFITRQSINSIYQPKIKLKINNQNIYNVSKNKINDCNNIIINFQDNKYLKRCLIFLIKIIMKVIVLDMFRYLKKYSIYLGLKNIIIKLNKKKIEKFYFTQFCKKIKKIKNTRKNKNCINSKNGGKNNNKNSFKKNKKIIFNSVTKRYELVSY